MVDRPINIAAIVNTDYNEVFIVLRNQQVLPSLLRLNDITIPCGFFGITLQQCTFCFQ